jgi:hypothetical protein
MGQAARSASKRKVAEKSGKLSVRAVGSERSRGTSGARVRATWGGQTRLEIRFAPARPKGTIAMIRSEPTRDRPGALAPQLHRLLATVRGRSRAVGLPRCGARCRDGHSCQAPPTWDPTTRCPRNGRCRMHGGLSTGARTTAGRARLREAGRCGAAGRWRRYRASLVRGDDAEETICRNRPSLDDA